MKQTKQGRPDDECWQHVERIGEKRWKCKYCSRAFLGTVTRVKAHLAGLPGQQIAVCHGAVPDNVRRAALDGLRRGRTETREPQLKRAMADVESSRQTQSDLRGDDDISAPNTAAGVGDEILQANEVSSSFCESAVNLLVPNRSFEGSINGSVDGPISRFLDGSIDGSISGYLDGSIDGSISGFLHGSFNGSITGFDGSIDGPISQHFEGFPDLQENNATTEVNSAFNCDHFFNGISDSDDYWLPKFGVYPHCGISTSTHAQPQEDSDMINNQPLEGCNQTMREEDVEEGLPSRKKQKADIKDKPVDQGEFTHESPGPEMVNYQSLEANNQAIPAEDVEEQLRLIEPRSRMKRRAEVMAMSDDQREIAQESTGGKTAHKISLARLQKVQNERSAKDPSKATRSRLEAAVRPRGNQRKRPYKPPLNMKWSQEEAHPDIGDPDFSFGNRAVDSIMTSEMDRENYKRLSPSELIRYFSWQNTEAMKEVVKLTYDKDRLNQKVKQVASWSFKLRVELIKVKNEFMKLKEHNGKLQATLAMKNMEAKASEREEILEAYLNGMNAGFENCLDQVKLQFPQLDESMEKINRFKKVINGQLVDDEDD